MGFHARILLALVFLSGCDLPSAIAPSALEQAPPETPATAAGDVTPLPPIDPPRPKSAVSPEGVDNAELAGVLAADERDHQSGANEDRREIEARDEARRDRAIAMLEGGGARTAADYFAVAVIFQHGTSLDDFADARRYAALAARLGDRRGVRLAAAAWDRWLVRAGYRQRFGTRADCTADGCRLHAYDPTVSDEERARWDLPPLAVLKRDAAWSRRP